MLDTVAKRAFISAGLQHQSVTLPINQYAVFRFCREADEWGVAMCVSSKAYNREILTKALQKRFAEPLLYDGYYLCMDSEKRLLIWHPIKDIQDEPMVEESLELMAALVDIPFA